LKFMNAHSPDKNYFYLIVNLSTADCKNEGTK
jgi:hypothetical protein